MSFVTKSTSRCESEQELAKRKAETKEQVLDRLPGEVLGGAIVNAQLFSNLLWNDTELIILRAKVLKISECKPLARKIRELQRAYEIDRSRHLASAFRQRESELAEAFEDILEDEIEKLRKELRDGIHERRPFLDPEWLTFLVTVHRVLVLGDALRRYDRYKQRQFAQYGVNGYTIIPAQVSALIDLLGEYAGDSLFFNEMSCCERYAKSICKLAIPMSEQIIAKSAALFGVSSRDVLSNDRHAMPVMARHAAIRVMHEQGLTHEQITAAAGRHRSTIIHSLAVSEDLLLTNRDFALKYSTLTDKCQS